MAKKMEPTRVYWGNIGIMERKWKLLYYIYIYIDI